jgi:surface antigen
VELICLKKFCCFFAGAALSVTCIIGIILARSASSSAPDTAPKTHSYSSSSNKSASEAQSSPSETKQNDQNKSKDTKSQDGSQTANTSQSNGTPSAATNSSNNEVATEAEAPATQPKQTETPQNQPAEPAKTQPTETQPAETPNNTQEAVAQTTEDKELEQMLAAMEAARSASLYQGAVITPDPDKCGYPYKERCPAAQKDAFVDPWGMYICECVSYTAWKVYQTYGYMPYWGGIGNANQWPSNARSMGIPVSTIPKPQSVGISNSSYYGHSVWIEEVSEDGKRVHVSQYNERNAMTNYLGGEYSEQWIPADSLTYIYFGE